MPGHLTGLLSRLSVMVLLPGGLTGGFVLVLGLRSLLRLLSLRHLVLMLMLGRRLLLRGRRFSGRLNRMLVGSLRLRFGMFVFLTGAVLVTRSFRRRRFKLRSLLRR